MKITFSFVDIETTGLEFSKGHRIIEVAIIIYSYDTATKKIEKIGSYVTRVNPCRSIDAKSQAVHHISLNDLEDEPLWEDVVDKVVSVLNTNAETHISVAHNKGFDFPFLANEITRVGRKIPEIETFCTMENGRFATFDGSVPSLRKLCEAFDIEYNPNKAHSALYDVSLTAKCFFLGLRCGAFIVDESIFLNQQEVA